jgi:hypothetical protein
VTGSAHLRGIVIAGVLAAVALALGFVTLAMNQTASKAATTHTIIPLHLRHHVAGAQTTSSATKTTPTAAKKKPKPVARVNPNFTAALKAGLPRSVARALAAHPVAVVQLTSQGDQIAELALGEARAGSTLAGATLVPIDVDGNGGDVEVLTRLLGKLPIAPATLIYIRPATLYVTLPGFNDRTIIQQAAENANSATAASNIATTPAATPTPTTPPAATTPTATTGAATG